MSDNGVSGRATTAVLLANDPSPQVLEALKEALTDKDPSVRAAVAHAIALRNDPALMAALLPLFDDAKEAVRLRAAAGYLRLVMAGEAATRARQADATGEEGRGSGQRR